jgi:hypothetical protein
MKKLLVASAVSAVFAAPATALAQAKPPAAPTLDKVLEASGISVSGHIDVGYTRADRNIEAGVAGSATGAAPRVFDNQNNSFALHQLGLTIAKQPKQGFGGLVNITAGADAQVLNTAAGTGSSQFDLTQAYAQYAGGPLTVIAGRFVTLHGTEVIASPGNTNISRSILFAAVPLTHTGARATLALNDRISLIGGVNNGWDQPTDANRTKTVELGATLNPTKPLTIAVSTYIGKEPEATGTGSGNRNSINAVASYSVTDALSVGAEVLNVTREVPGAGSSFTKNKYNGAAGYASYTLTPKLRGTARVEQFDDKNGIFFGTAGGRKYREMTATGAYLPADNFEVRAELRRDQANSDAFRRFEGGASKALMTIALQGLYKF